MKRRGFLSAALKAAALLVAPAAWIARRIPVAKVTVALRGRRFPGRVSTLDGEAARRPGPWAG